MNIYLPHSEQLII